MTLPIMGEKTATIRTATVNASEIWPRDHPNRSCNGLMNVPNVKITSEPKLTMVPGTEIAMIRAPDAVIR